MSYREKQVVYNKKNDRFEVKVVDTKVIYIVERWVL